MMQLKGAIELRGHLILRHLKDGILLTEERFSNTVTDMGRDQVAGLINGTRTGAFSYIAVGTSGTAAAVGDIALKAEIAAGSLARAASTTSQETTDTTNDTSKLLHSFSVTGSYTVKEVAIANSASGGRIFGRTTNFTAKAMSSGEELQVSYSIDVD